MIRKSRTLLVAPYVGEFGWELMNWHGRVRRVVEQGGYAQVVIATPADRRALYQFDASVASVIFHATDDLKFPGSANEDHRIDADGQRVSPDVLRALINELFKSIATERAIELAETDCLIPDFDGRLWPTLPLHQSFANLRRGGPIRTDVVLIPRRRDLATERNLSAAEWDSLAQRLTHVGLTVAAYANHLDRAIEQLSHTRLAVGASTGGLHLASLCRCPHYVWGCGAEEKWTGLGMTNRQRYETFWNPLGTRVIYDECGWQPGVEYLFQQITRAIKTIGIKDGAVPVERTISPSWRIKRTLARIVQSDRAWPWRVRRLVHEHLV